MRFHFSWAQDLLEHVQSVKVQNDAFMALPASECALSSLALPKELFIYSTERARVLARRGGGAERERSPSRLPTERGARRGTGSHDPDQSLSPSQEPPSAPRLFTVP